jgi:hypothetical protein
MADLLAAGVTKSVEDLHQILWLQERNLKQNLSQDEKDSEGFVTMRFTIEMLTNLHNVAPSVVVRNGDTIIAYAIVLLKEGRHYYPDLETMFLHLETIEWDGKLLAGYRYYVMGQICIDKAYRGGNVFSILYATHRDLYQAAFDCLVTEISTSNRRSMRAHEKIGFKTIDKYRDAVDEWNVVVWDWRQDNF